MFTSHRYRIYGMSVNILIENVEISTALIVTSRELFWSIDTRAMILPYEGCVTPTARKRKTLVLATLNQSIDFINLTCKHSIQAMCSGSTHSFVSARYNTSPLQPTFSLCCEHYLK
jgi:hypothetical protein